MVRRLSLAVVLSLVVSGSAALAHERSGGRRARLSPPDGAPFPEARGEVSLGHEAFVVRIRGVDPGDYTVCLDDGTGTLTGIGTITVVADDDDEDDSEGGGGSRSGDDDDDDEDGDDLDDEAEGALVLRGDSLPFGATSPADLAGRALTVKDGAGTAVLQGMTPTPIVEEPKPRSGRCPLSRPDPAVDADAEGVLKLESGGGRVVIKVHLSNLEAGQVYEVTITDPATGTSESLGMTTIDEGGEGHFKIDSEKGDSIPFGAGDLAALLGFAVSVKDPSGAVVLTGTICPAQPRPDDDGDDDDDDDDGDDDDGDDDHEDRECEAGLARPDPAPDADARGEVEIEGDEELEFEVKNLEAGATYDVVLTDPATGTSETAGQIQVGEDGEGELEIEPEEGASIPFGKASLAELAGFMVEVKDSTGAVVLQGTVPGTDCPDDDEDDDDEDDGDDDEGDDDEDDHDGDRRRGGGGAFPLEEPLFVVLGHFDAPFLRGDVNRDETIDISDPVSILLFLFLGADRPYCLDAADGNDDGLLDITDPIEILSTLFLGGARLPEPGSFIAGSDPTADDLYCEEPIATP